MGAVAWVALSVAAALMFGGIISLRERRERPLPTSSRNLARRSFATVGR